MASAVFTRDRIDLMHIHAVMKRGLLRLALFIQGKWEAARKDFDLARSANCKNRGNFFPRVARKLVTSIRLFHLHTAVLFKSENREINWTLGNGDTFCLMS